MDGNERTEILASPVEVAVTITADVLTVTLNSSIVAGSDDRTPLLLEMLRDTAEQAVLTIQAAREALCSLTPSPLTSQGQSHAKGTRDAADGTDSCGGR